jgi:hypothetical protein
VIAEAVERAAAGDLAGEAPVLALVEERACLLTGPWSGEIADAVLVNLDPFRNLAAD